VIDEKSMIVIEHSEGAKGLESFHEVRLVPLLQDQAVAIARNITERKSAEAALEQMHKQLADASRKVGMAEIANNVLHNVGNVLNQCQRFGRHYWQHATRFQRPGPRQSGSVDERARGRPR